MGEGGRIGITGTPSKPLSTPQAAYRRIDLYTLSERKKDCGLKKFFKSREGGFVLHQAKDEILVKNFIKFEGNLRCTL